MMAKPTRPLSGRVDTLYSAVGWPSTSFVSFESERRGKGLRGNRGFVFASSLTTLLNRYEFMEFDSMELYLVEL